MVSFTNCVQYCVEMNLANSICSGWKGRYNCLNEGETSGLLSTWDFNQEGECAGFNRTHVWKLYVEAYVECSKLHPMSLWNNAASNGPLAGFHFFSVIVICAVKLQWTAQCLHSCYLHKHAVLWSHLCMWDLLFIYCTNHAFDVSCANGCVFHNQSFNKIKLEKLKE